MTLLLHIVIALSSIIVSGLLLARPSRRLLHASYALVAATLTSGTYLVVLSPAHLPSACASGLLYLAIAGIMTAVARLKLAKQIDL